MSEIRMVIPDSPSLLKFSGPDAVRFLNGQLTQDVRRVAGGKVSLPSCVTDAKGKLQFRVRIAKGIDDDLWIEGPAGSAEALEARLTRYLIADDAEVADLTGGFRLIHFPGPAPVAPEGVITRSSNRYGTDGTDWWVPSGMDNCAPDEAMLMSGDELESYRIANGVPVWGRELVEGILPPEAGLESSDISYQKGCYIGQEVISRIKSAGKVNKRLAKLQFDAALPVDSLQLVNSEGLSAGELTSISPLAAGQLRDALGYVKRGISEVFVSGPDGVLHPVLVI
jgi:tRNA-modifying protein YgfZ